jgi:hypothetical protein
MKTFIYRLFILACITIFAQATNAQDRPYAHARHKSCYDGVIIKSNGDKMTVANVRAPHSHIDVYKIMPGGGWQAIFSCNDNCGDHAHVDVEPNQAYLIHVKLFTQDWELMCDKKLNYTTPYHHGGGYGGGHTDNHGTPTTHHDTPSYGTPSCDGINVSMTQRGKMRIENLNAPHEQIDVYKVLPGGGWERAFACNDNCGEQVFVNVVPNQKYIINVKMFNQDWSLIGDRKIDYTTSY